MPSGSEGDSWIGSLMLFFEMVGGVKPGPSGTGKGAAVTRATAEGGG